MCRIFSCASSEPNRDAPAIGAMLRDFGGLAVCGKVPNGAPEGHHDGWGIVAYREGAAVFYVRVAASAATDSRFGRAIEDLVLLTPDTVIAHLRKTSRGSLAIDNVQPFLADKLAFCHNGAIAIDGVDGESDSLAAFRRGLADGGTAEAVSRAVASGRVGGKGYTGAITVICDGTSLAVKRDWNVSHPDAAARDFDSYYTMNLFEQGSMEAACSEPLAALADFSKRSLINGEEVKIR
ncbi:MAG TPA: class II glutamine amidotransferase [Candidatus Paceibacterota bacterium]